MKQKQQLITGLKQLKLNCSSNQVDQLLDYAELLLKWNQTHNLISARDNKHLINRHILDSLSLASYLHVCGTKYSRLDCTLKKNSEYRQTRPQNFSILDFGTGAGLPGLPLAILYPHYSFALLDSNNKKIAFLNYCKSYLNLNNIKPLCERVESHSDLYPVVITRAVSEVTQLVKLLVSRLADNGTIFAMLGKKPTSESIDHLKKTIKYFKLDRLKFDFNTGQRHLLIVGNLYLNDY